jgi:predicted RNA polymerase sigma factor
VGRAILLHELGRHEEAEAAFARAAEVARDPGPYAARLADYRRLRARLRARTRPAPQQPIKPSRRGA